MQKTPGRNIMNKIISEKLLTYSTPLLLCITFSSNSLANTNHVQFVSKVSKKCKHIGSIRTVIDNKKVFLDRKKGEARGIHRWIKNGHEIFTLTLKKQAVAQGANRLVVKDINYDMDIIVHRGIQFFKIKRTHIRARAFRC